MSSGREPRQALPTAVRLPLERLDAVLFELDVVLRDVAPDVTAFPGTVELVERLCELGLSTAVVVAHRCCREALRAGGV
ncbi:hypothetical protein [Micromonospora sp. NPDC000442]|uniref:hypothetical protein n=1 Tax=Micromonospora sp. NPDC000442 TaxID=3364217 RepID=UPI0036850961